MTEYLAINHPSPSVRRRARYELATVITDARLYDHMVTIGIDDDLSWMIDDLRTHEPPETITYRMDGQFYRVISRQWAQPAAQRDDEPGTHPDRP